MANENTIGNAGPTPQEGTASLAPAATPQAADELAVDFGADDELSGLFAAFEDVKASDELKAATIERVLDAAMQAQEKAGATAELAAAGERAGDECATTDEPAMADERAVTGEVSTTAELAAAGERAGDAAAAPNVLVIAGGKVPGGNGRARRRAKRRAIRVAVLAACLVLALTGGVAYATPTAHLQVSGDDASIDLGVNRFGIVVSADADDEEVAKLVEASQLRNKPSAEAIEGAFDVLGRAGGDEPIEVDVRADDGAQRERLEREAADSRTRFDERHRATEPSASAESPTAPGVSEDGQASGNAAGSMQPGAGPAADFAGESAPQGDAESPNESASAPADDAGALPGPDAQERAEANREAPADQTGQTDQNAAPASGEREQTDPSASSASSEREQPDQSPEAAPGAQGPADAGWGTQGQPPSAPTGATPGDRR